MTHSEMIQVIEAARKATSLFGMETSGPKTDAFNAAVAVRTEARRVRVAAHTKFGLGSKQWRTADYAVKQAEAAVTAAEKALFTR